MDERRGAGVRRGRGIPLGCLLAVLAWASPAAAAYVTRFPARAASLPCGTYFASSGHGRSYGPGFWAMDVGAVRYTGDRWATETPPGTSNDDVFVFGASLHAPEDGEIIACWRTAPDKPSPDRDYDFDGDGEGDDSPTNSGNFLSIRNAAGTHVMSLAHLEHDSIPEELCPLPLDRDADGDGWPDRNDQETCTEPGFTAYFRAANLLPSPVPIAAGDFLGRVGHSGQSGGPHLHVQVRRTTVDDAGVPCNGEYEEILFSDAWAQECDGTADVSPDGWSLLAPANPLMAASHGGAASPRHCFLLEDPEGSGDSTDGTGDDESSCEYGTGRDGSGCACGSARTTSPVVAALGMLLLVLGHRRRW